MAYYNKETTTWCWYCEIYKNSQGNLKRQIMNLQLTKKHKFSILTKRLAKKKNNNNEKAPVEIHEIQNSYSKA